MKDTSELEDRLLYKFIFAAVNKTDLTITQMITIIEFDTRFLDIPIPTF